MRTVQDEGGTLVIACKPTGYWLLCVPLFVAPVALPYLSSLVFGAPVESTGHFGLLLAGVGGVILATTRSAETRIDRGRQVITSRRRALWGGAVERSYPFAALRKVAIKKIPGRYTTGYRLELQMAGNETVLLAGKAEADAVPGELEAIARRIEEAIADGQPPARPRKRQPLS